MANQFIETRNMFSAYTGLSANQQLSYDEWMSLPDSSKAAALFVIFFDQITLAWNKAKADFTPDEDGVDVINQYLMKNVPFIKEDKERYTSNYVYRVAYNCMDCLRYVEREKFRSMLESSNVVETSDDTLDLYDMVPDEIDFDLESRRSSFWKTIEQMGPEAEKVVNHLLNGDSLHKVSTRAINRDNDPLKDVSVSKAKYQEILNELRSKLSVYKEDFLGSVSELEVASEEDLVPKNLRKQSTISEQVYEYMKKRGSINLFEAERLFLITRMPLNKMMHEFQEKGYPVKFHWIDGVIPTGHESEMIDYYYLAK